MGVLPGADVPQADHLVLADGDSYLSVGGEAGLADLGVMPAVWRSLPVFASHRQMRVWSPAARPVRPSGVNASAFKYPRVLRRSRCLPAAQSHRQTIPSSPAQPRVLPSGEKATHLLIPPGAPSSRHR